MIDKGEIRDVLSDIYLLGRIGASTDEPLEEVKLTNRHRFRIRALELMDTNALRTGGVFCRDNREIDQRARFQALQVHGVLDWKFHHHGFHVAGDLVAGNSNGVMSAMDFENNSESGVAFCSEASGAQQSNKSAQ